jgi:hypothetical protein
MLGVASDGLVAPSGLLDHPSDLSQLSVNAVVGSRPDPHNFQRFVLPALRGLPRAEIAAAAGVTERAVRDWLGLRSTPSATHREALARLARRHQK